MGRLSTDKVIALAHEAAEAARDAEVGTSFRPTASDALEFIIQMHYEESDGDDVIVLDDSERSLFTLHYMELMLGSDQSCTVDCECGHNCNCGGAE